MLDGLNPDALQPLPLPLPPIVALYAWIVTSLADDALQVADTETDLLLPEVEQSAAV